MQGLHKAAVLFSTLLLIPLVLADDTVPVPSDKSKINSWFQQNVGPLSSRKGTLDPALVTAEATPKIIKLKADGSGEFKTITDAIKSIPADNTNRVIISLGPGNYTEKIKIERNKPFISFVGDAKNMPVLVYGGTAAKYGTVESGTLIVESDYFTAVNIILANSAPRPKASLKGGQALALRIGGDKAAFYNCKFLGFQDTLCDDKGMHLFKDCYIEGTVDFIFGNGKSIYLNVETHVIPGDQEAWITAQARHNNAEDTGYAFLHCKVTGTGKSAYLGRSWMPYGIVVFAYSELSDVIIPAGWSNNNKPETEKTTMFGEFSCTGPGAEFSARASIAKKLTEADAKPYLTLGFIQASKWLLPPTQVPA